MRRLPLSSRSVWRRDPLWRRLNGRRGLTHLFARTLPAAAAPQPPVEGECCGRGCEYCVWVYYDQALRRYEAALAQWREQYGGQA